jgi:UDPglucose 6-dehydrogenase
MLAATVDINHRQRERAVRLLLDAVAGRDDPTVGILGLAFKPHTDDFRGSPALDVARELLAAGVRVRGHDPHAMAKAQGALPPLELGAGPYDTARGADALLLATEWP